MAERDIFIAALEKEGPAERRAYLDEACAAQPELRRQVEELLRLHEGAGSFLDNPAAASATSGATQGAAARASSPEVPGAVIGRYKLIEQIGEGGMGTVWMAQQTAPVKRLVAVKLIKAGMDSRQVIARFEAERQALALMDHTNIARVLDAGTTQGEPGGVRPGIPYFVMELVKGVPITRYCDEHHLTPRQRLELFIPVCQAVQHAHQKGVIHRDLKPSNVLVALYDGKPVPKVIDFGVAKAAGQPLTEKTLVTGLGNIVGTPEYMSPEQAEINQLDVDTRSDIYSLGVLLYELLTGNPPFTKKDLEKVGMLEMLRVIREQEPSKPSTKLSTAQALPTLAANRGTEPAKLTRLVRGELDWIVMKALEKDRSRRYETANGFAMDLRRYLADEPVQACPPSAGYRLRKFARRNKGLFVSAGIVAAALLLGIVGTTWQAIRATHASTTATFEAKRANREAGRATAEARRATAMAEEARTEAAIARAVNDFLNEDLLGSASPYNEPDRDIKLRTVVDRADEKMEGRFRDQPLVEAAIRNTLGHVYFSLGEHVKAEEQHRRALELHRRHLGSQDAITAATITDLATALHFQGRLDEAETLHREALVIKRRVLGPDHPSAFDNLTGLANVNLAHGRFAEAEKLHREVYEARRRVLGPEDPHTLLSQSSVGLALKRQGRNAEAEQLYREILAIRTRLLRPEHPDILTTMTFLAGALRDQDRMDEAEGLYRQVYEARRRVLGPQHPATLRSMMFLAHVVERQGRYADAEPLWDQGMVQSRRGIELRQAGRREEAAEAFRQAIALLVDLADEFPETRNYRQHLGRCYIWLSQITNDASEKGAVLSRALPLWQRLADDFPNVAWVWSDLGEVHALMGQWQEGVDAQTKAIALNDQFPAAWERRAWARANLRQWKDALDDRTKAVELDPNDWVNRWRHGEIHGALKQWPEALADYDQAIELGSKGPDVWVSKAVALAQLNQPEQAVTALREAVAKGFHNSKDLQRRDDLAALRDRDDFKKLLTELEAKLK